MNIQKLEESIRRAIEIGSLDEEGKDKVYCDFTFFVKGFDHNGMQAFMLAPSEIRVFHDINTSRNYSVPYGTPEANEFQTFASYAPELARMSQWYNVVLTQDLTREIRGAAELVEINQFELMHRVVGTEANINEVFKKLGFGLLPSDNEDLAEVWRDHLDYPARKLHLNKLYDDYEDLTRKKKINDQALKYGATIEWNPLLEEIEQWIGERRQLVNIETSTWLDSWQLDLPSRYRDLHAQFRKDVDWLFEGKFSFRAK